MQSELFTQNWDEEMFDEKTGHKLVSLGGKVYELKLCTRCGQWVPIEEFRHSKRFHDGLSPYCKKCISYKKRSNPTVKSSEVKLLSKDEAKQAEYVSTIENGVKGLTSEISKLRARVKEVELECEKNRIDLNHLSEKEIEHVLMENNVQPRILFNAIKAHNSQYTFYCLNTSTGEMIPIKTEAA